MNSETEVTAPEMETVTVEVPETDLAPAAKATPKKRAKKVEPVEVVLVEPEGLDLENAQAVTEESIREWALRLRANRPRVKVITDARDIPVKGPKEKPKAKASSLTPEWFAAKKRLYGTVKKYSRVAPTRDLPGWHWVANSDEGFSPDQVFAMISRTRTPEGALKAVQKAIDKKLAEVGALEELLEPVEEPTEAETDELSEAS